MEAREAQTLQPGDFVLQRGQLFRIAQVGLSGGQARLIGKTYDQIVRPTRQDIALVYRAADVPPGCVPGWLTPEEEAAIRAIISARKAAETREETR